MRASDRARIDFAALYPDLIADGAAAVAAADPDARVLFNCVEGFPLSAVADAPAAALYLELWPPDIAYRDLTRWIEQARAQGSGRAVVIAAYVSALRTFEMDRAARPGAIEAAVLLTSIIAAAGAYHHVLAERDRLLVEGYYPEARRLRVGERRDLQAAWAFSARYVHLLSDAGLCQLDVGSLVLRDATSAPIPVSPTPAAGSVWVRASRTTDGTIVVHLLDLLDQTDDRWDAVRQPSPVRRGWRLDWPGHAVGTGMLAMSPWTAGGQAGRVDADDLPTFRRWLVIAAPTH